MKNSFWTFLAGFFQDQTSGSMNGGSRKAIVAYFLCFCFFTLVTASAQGIKIEPISWYCVTGLLAWTVGAITTETILKYFGKPGATPPAE